MYAWKLPFLILLLCFAGLAFGLGYVAYPLLHPYMDALTVDLARPSSSGTLKEDRSAATATADTGTDMQLLWEVWRLLDRDFFGDKPNEDARRYGAVRGLVDSFGDPYTFFVEPQPRELEQDSLRGSFGGVGAYILRDEDGFKLSPMPGQPAEKAGIREGDLLLLVDDTEITLEMSEDDVVALVRGPVDTEVVLVVRRAVANDESDELTIAVNRAVIETPSIEYSLLEKSELEQSGATAEVGYIRHLLFTERSPAEMEQAIDELVTAGATRFVLDLRGNPGGILDSATKTADIWLDGGLILVEERADGARQEYRALPGGAGVNFPLVVIVDGASASASEIVAGALQDNGRAQVVGEQTFGKGSVQLIHPLTDDSSLHVTTAEWFTPDGRQISGQGLTPDQVIEPGSDPLPVSLELLRDEAVAESSIEEDSVIWPQ